MKADEISIRHLLIPLAAVFWPGSPFGVARWGHEGHKIVCEIAWQRLDTTGRALVDELSQHSSSSTFAESCNWADAVRYTSHRYTRNYHFINIASGSGGVDLERDCGDIELRCVPWAVQHYALLLQGRSRSGPERAEALWFLGHFVADLHQPMHAGRLADRGGNSIDVTFVPDSDCPARNLSLHTVWDSTFLCHAGLTWPDGAHELNNGITDEQAAAWADLDVLGWTNESFELDETFAYVLPRNHIIGPAYRRRAVQLSEIQLQRAGVRLAVLINAAAAGTIRFSD